MLRPLLQSLSVLALLLVMPALSAQTFSYDGNRWYEIEVSIFTNAGYQASDEILIPERTTLAYPEPIRQLVPAIRSFMVPFDAAPGPAFLPGSVAREEVVPVYGPSARRESGDFRLTDFNRDPFIALGRDYARFDDYNQDLRRSPDHRLLFHAVWRQPVLNRVQATAIQVAGGDQYGAHAELEGSLVFSYDVNRVDVDADLWLARFGQPGGAVASRWTLPDPPFAGETDVTLPELPVIGLDYMHQTREMISNELHYLDHPALGVLVEIRPYQLPELTGLSFD